MERRELLMNIGIVAGWIGIVSGLVGVMRYNSTCAPVIEQRELARTLVYNKMEIDEEGLQKDNSRVLCEYGPDLSELIKIEGNVEIRESVKYMGENGQEFYACVKFSPVQ
ncbi:MAG: hypothetical protein ABIJ18_05290 [archaeon]